MVPDLRPDQAPTGEIREFTSSRHPSQTYYLYVPPTYNGSTVFRLLVVIHGQSRSALTYAERFLQLADRHQYLLLAPLFSGATRYQQLGLGSPRRADLRLLELVDEIATDFSVEAGQFDLFGYSGGAQFAHRFLYVHPARLRSVVVGAPGTITVPSGRYRWPNGLRGLASSGVTFDLDAVRRPRIMLIVGGEDVTLDGLNQSEQAMRFGTTRLGRARTLHAALSLAGIEHEFVEVPNVGHGLDGRIVDEAYRFLAGGLPTRR